MRIYVGYDSREDIAYEVCKYSIHKQNSDIEVIPLKLTTLKEIGAYTRDVDPKATTEFTFSRFFVPYLMGYKGWALFVDCDFLFLKDPAEIFEQANDKYAVMCVQHDYTPKATTKMDGKPQLQYPRKNWSSCVLYNCAHSRNAHLNLENLNSKDGLWHHRFSWIDDSEIGKLSHEWNWLTDWYKDPEDGSPKALHYTEGGPWFDNYKDTAYADIWLDIEAEFKNKRYWEGMK